MVLRCSRWSKGVEKRVKALKKLEYESIKQLNVNFHVELHALETKYQQLFAPLDQQVDSFSRPITKCS